VCGSFITKGPMFKKPLILIILAGIILAFQECKKQDPATEFEQTSFVKEGLSEEEDSALASLPSHIFTPSEILLENGETIERFLKRTNPALLPNWGNRVFLQVEDKKMLFVSDLLSMGTKLTKDVTKRPAGADPVQQPEQIGYGYVYNNSLDLDKRKKAGQCDLLLYGIDCSGMVTLMLQNALHRSLARYEANSLASEEILNSFLKATPGFEDFEYVDVNDPVSFSSQITAGDIIYFSKVPGGDAFHIGVALNKAGDNQIWVYQSNGTDSKPGCGTFANKDRRGPRTLPLHDYNTSTGTVLGILDLKYKDDVMDTKGKVIHRKHDKVYPYYGVLHLKTGDNPTQLTLLTKDVWKFKNENSSISTGGHKLPIHENSVDAHNLTLKFDPQYKFTFTGIDDSNNPFTESGTFTFFNNGGSIRESGAELYGQDPIDAKLLTLTDKELTLQFVIQQNGFTQTSILYFEK
jgi:hypothetical protein